MGMHRIIKESYCWIMALSFVGLTVLGWYMMRLAFYDRWYHDALSFHKSLGMVMLFLVFLKMAGTFIRAGAVGGVRSFFSEIFVKKKISHPLFYLLVAVITVSGYLISSSAGAPVSVFGLFRVPAVVMVTRGVEEAVIACHYYGAYVTALLVLLHGVTRLRLRLGWKR